MHGMADRIIQLPSGRAVGFSAFGDALARRLVLLCLPTGLAGAFDPDPLVTEPWGVRMIVIDRPGYGPSAVLPDGAAQSVEERADDLAEYVEWSETLADEVSKADFGRIGVIGWGSGAVFAAAVAARHPDLVDRLALVGPHSPHHGRKERRAGLIDATKVHAVASVAQVADDLSSTEWNTSAALGIDDADPAFSSIEGLGARFDRSLAEAATQGALGVAGDLLALHDDSWTDDLRVITADTLIVAGADDPVADEKSIAWWSKRVAGAEVDTVPGAGRLVIAPAWERILGHVAPDHGGLPPEAR